MLKQRSKLQLLIFLCMYSVKAVSAPSPGSIPPELHACWWQLGPLIHNQRLCLISFRLLGEFLLSKSIIRVDRMMKFNELLLSMVLLVLLFPESTVRPSSGAEWGWDVWNVFNSAFQYVWYFGIASRLCSSSHVFLWAVCIDAAYSCMFVHSFYTVLSTVNTGRNDGKDVKGPYCCW